MIKKIYYLVLAINLIKLKINGEIFNIKNNTPKANAR
jgi:hypothetical protein